MDWSKEADIAYENGCVMFYQSTDFIRLNEIEHDKPVSEDPIRNPFWKDYQRVISSPAFRRLKGKTQLFPGHESDFFRCRLTHSLEVAHIGKSIARRLNAKLKSDYERLGLKEDKYFSFIDTDLVEFACVAHDIGHAPFGHQGEEELNNQMGKFGGFEGNAQTLRILTRLEKKILDDKYIIDKNPIGFSKDSSDDRFGLNPTSRGIASILKYDTPILKLKFEKQTTEEKQRKQPKVRELKKGYYGFDQELVSNVKENVIGRFSVKIGEKEFKTVECQIMDIADDIAYSVYDLEDSFKGGFINILDLIEANTLVYTEIAKKINEKYQKANLRLTAKSALTIVVKFFSTFLDGQIASIDHDTNKSLYEEIEKPDEELGLFLTSVFYSSFKHLSSNGYIRGAFFSKLIGTFINEVEIKFDVDHPFLSKVFFRIDPNNQTKGISNTQILIEIIKRFTYYYQIQSPKLKIIEYRGKEIVKEIFEAIIKTDGIFLPEDVRRIYSVIKNSKKTKSIKSNLLNRTVCDFVASMTDKYAFDYYSRLKSENAQSIFKEM